MDLARVNPLANPILDFAEQPGLRSLTQFVSPAYSGLVDAATGRSTFRSAPLNIDGMRTPPTVDEAHPGLEDAARIWLRNFARSNAPIRVADDLLNRQGQEQGDDSIPILGDRPIDAGQTDRELEAQDRRHKLRGDRTEQLLDNVISVRRKGDDVVNTVSNRVYGDKLRKIAEEKARLKAKLRKQGKDEKNDPRYIKLTEAETALENARSGKKPKKKGADPLGGFGQGGGDPLGDFGALP